MKYLKSKKLKTVCFLHDFAKKIWKLPADHVGLVWERVVWRVYLSLALPLAQYFLVALCAPDVGGVRLNKIWKDERNRQIPQIKEKNIFMICLKYPA